MNIDFMRFVDYTAGIPLTFIATRIVRLVSLFRKPGKSDPENVLFIELSEMGSVILADPAMRKARDYFKAELYFCIFAGNKESIALLDTVPSENVFAMRDDGFVHLAIDALKFLFWTRKKRIDTVFDLELFSRVTALLTGFSGAQNRIGFFAFHNEGLYRGDLLTHKVWYNPHMHIAKNFIALINALISPATEVPYSKTHIHDREISLPKIDPDDRQKENMWRKVQSVYEPLNRNRHHLVLINANAGDLLPQRRWPAENFLALIRMVRAYDRTALLLLTGSLSEREELNALVNMAGNKRCINFAGKLPLGELPVLYSIATLMVTNDSGPGHFSSVTGMPAFILFGPETPSLYGSLGNSTAIYAGLACSPCVSAFNHRKTPCKNNVCLKAITPETVFNQIKPYLRNSGKPEET